MTAIRHWYHTQPPKDDLGILVDREYSDVFNFRADDLRSGGEKLISIVEAEFPQHMKLFYPRVYDEAGRYHSPKVIAAGLSSMLAEMNMAQRDLKKVAVATQLTFAAMKPMVDRRMPLFFIAPQLLAAIKRTTFKEDIDWSTIKLPYEEGIFVLPRNAFHSPRDGDVGFIIWSRKRKGMRYYAPDSPDWVTIDDDCFDLIAFCPSSRDAVWFDAHITALRRPHIRLGQLFFDDEAAEAAIAMSEDKQDARYPELPLVTKRDAILSLDEKQFLEQISVIAFGTLMAMLARPELLEAEQRLRMVPPKKDRPAKEFWTPNRIGFFYRPPQQRQIVGGGTHASPRMHWRRGHYTNQVYGPGRTARKVIWIEPMLVCAGSEEEKTETETIEEQSR